MPATQIGTDASVGATTSAITIDSNSYIIESLTENEFEIDQEDVMDAAGARALRVIYSKTPTYRLTLLCKTGATPETDFVAGSLVSGTTLMVRNAPVTKTKAPHRVELDVIDYGLAAV